MTNSGTSPGERMTKIEVEMIHAVAALSQAAGERKEINAKLDAQTDSLVAIGRVVKDVQASLKEARADIEAFKRARTFFAGAMFAFGVVGSAVGVTLVTAKQWLISIWTGG